MFKFQQVGLKQKIPFTTKLVMIFWIISGLAILSFFAFGVVLIALMFGVVLFATNMFQKSKRPSSMTESSGFQTRTYSRPRNTKDDDVIDI
jgi:ABC-type transport system involved in cytochrome bd biosynthesis fused ATPase/permease subunit